MKLLEPKHFLQFLTNISKMSLLYRVAIFVFLICPCTEAFTQSTKIDSLKNSIKTEKNDSNKVFALIRLSDELFLMNNYAEAKRYSNNILSLCDSKLYKNNNTFLKAKALALDNIADACFFQDSIKEAIEYGNKALLIWQKTNDLRKILADLIYNADLYRDIGNTTKALEYYNQSLRIARKLNDKKTLAEASLKIGGIYSYQQNTNKAIEYYEQSLKLSEFINDSIGIVGALNCIGVLNSCVKNYSVGMKYFNESLSICEKIHNQDLYSLTLCDVGDLLESKGELAKALTYYQKSLIIYRNLNDRYGIALLIRNIGRIYQRQKKLDKALQMYLESLEIMNKMHDKKGIITNLYNIAGIYLEQKKFNDAEKYCLESLKLAKELKFPAFIFECTKILSMTYAGMGNYEEAYKMHKLFKQMGDTINNSTSANTIAKYESEKEALQLKQKQIAKDAELTLANQKKLDQKNYWIYGSLGLFLLMTVLGGAIYKISKQKQKAAILENIVLEQKLLRTQMNPHFIFNILSSIQHFIYKDKKDEAHTYVGKFAKLMRSILENSREEFVSMEKEMKTLEHYLSLNQLLLDNKFNFKIDVDENIDVEHTQIPPMLAQPFIENALKHGIQNKEEPGFIKISFKQLDSKNIQFEVEDNGIGFTKIITADTIEHKSFATTITQERLGNLYNNKNVVISIAEVRNKLNEIIGTKTFFTIPYRYT